VRVCILGDARSIHIQRMARGLQTRGVRVRVVTRKTAAIRGVEVETFAVPRFGLRYPGRWRRRRALYLRRLFRSHDVVHVHFLDDWHITPELAATGRLVVSPWGSDIVPPPELEAFPPHVVQTRQSLIRAATAVTAWGPWFASETAAFAGIARDRVTCVPLGVDLDQFARQPAAGRGDPTVGFFKGFRPVYGPERLIRAIPGILDRVPDARFELIGDGPLREPCRGLARTLGVLEAIRWLEPQPHAALADRIAGWHVNVIPSVCESFGLAALEAAAMGVPTVANRVGGLQETVRHGETGLLVAAQDHAALAEAVARLLVDADLRDTLGAAGRKLVADAYAWGSCIDRWIAVYRRLVAKPTPAYGR
jgi:glycosyltransferase involved in cell wall biosynthesis